MMGSWSAVVVDGAADDQDRHLDQGGSEGGTFGI